VAEWISILGIGLWAEACGQMAGPSMPPSCRALIKWLVDCCVSPQGQMGQIEVLLLPCVRCVLW